MDGWIFERRPLDDSAIFVMTPEEYRRAQASNKFKRIQIDRKLPYPNGQDGFFFVRLAYVDDVDRVFAAEKEARRRPVVEQATVGGESVTVRHSLFEAGRLVDILDGDTSTLVRVMEANPALVEFEFPNPHSFTGLSADFGHMDFTVSVSLYAGENATPATYSQTYRGLPGDPHIELPFGTPPPQVTRVRIEIQDLNSGERAKIHIREIALKQ
ncbi:MAG: hypothetical protein M1358_19475 [Chloroflexi bacterium]|nr:hypothetical protein [Chloroflexota bacterium]